MEIVSSTQTWAIIGGGMLGLTLAHRLRQQGKEVTLFEAAPHFGGLAGAWRLGDITWDRHYHVTLLSDSHFRAILRELNLEQEMEWIVTGTGVYAAGKLHSVSNTMEFLRFPPLGWIDKLRLAGTILHASRVKNWKRLEKVLVADWLSRWSGRRTFERFWLPLLRSKLGENYKKTSAAFIWTTIQRLYAARRTGLKTEMFGYTPGGYARILEAFAQRLSSEGVTLRPGCPVSSVEGREGRIEVHLEPGGSEVFDQVVVTAPAPLAARICRGLTPPERERLNAILYQGIVCASVLLKKPLSRFYVTNLLDEGFPFTGVIEMTALVKPEHLEGHALVYLPRYLPVDDPFFDAPDEEVRELFLGGLARIYPHFNRSDVLAFRISRVRYVCPLSTLHYSEIVPPMTTSTRGLHLVNSAHILNGTLNVNETVQLAEQAAERLAPS